MGVTGAGKSTFINMFAEQTVVIGNDLASCQQFQHDRFISY